MEKGKVMNKIKKIFLILFFVLLFILIGNKSNASSSDLELNNLNFYAQILENGDMEVTEIWDIDIKNTIARYASKLVKSNMCVYLDASTTVASMIPYLPLLSNTYFVTNSPNLAIKLSELGHRVYVTGGELKLTTNAYIGGYALDFLDKFNFSLGFFGTNGIHLTSGFTTPDPSEASIKMKAISKCYSVYILASHNKFVIQQDLFNNR